MEGLGKSHRSVVRIPYLGRRRRILPPTRAPLPHRAAAEEEEDEGGRGVAAGWSRQGNRPGGGTAEVGAGRGAATDRLASVQTQHKAWTTLNFTFQVNFKSFFFFAN